MKPAFAPALLALAGLIGSVAVAHADLAPWDPPKVAELTRQLEVATRQLYDAFAKVPPLEKGSAHTRDYFRFRQEARQMTREARWLARALEKNLGQEETLPGYESLRAALRGAQQDAAVVQTGPAVPPKLAEVQGLLDRLSPYYDAAAKTPTR